MVSWRAISFLIICSILLACNAFAVSNEATSADNHRADSSHLLNNSTKEDHASYGSGFLVAKGGYIVTNAHVVSGCDHINVTQGNGGSYPAKLLFQSKKEDLALVRIDTKSEEIAVFRTSSIIKLGESVYVYGFPLKGALSTSGNFTLGNITALAGVRDDTSEVQISAPVQPGNSGGPLLDSGGRVIGIVTSKLNAIKVAAVTRDIAQNINFAIKGSEIINFLSGHGVDISVNNDTKELPSVEIAEKSKNITYCIECLSSPKVGDERGRISESVSEHGDGFDQQVKMIISNIVLTTKPESLDRIKPYFSDKVFFYGKPISREDVFNQKIKYLQRWDVLKYEILDCKIDPGRSRDEFVVKSRIKFFGKRPNKEVSGITETTWTITYKANELKIISENSKILERF